MDANKRVDHLIDIMSQIPLDGKISILTGSNGSGKSLIRKQLVFHVAKKLEVEPKGGLVSGVSMETRTASRPEFSAFSSAMHDVEWLPTSYSTIKLIDNLIDIASKQYLVIDEPEIGMGEETVMALVNFLNKKFKELPQDVLGVLVISHNRYLVDNLESDAFFNTDGIKTKEEWLNRELVPTDLDMLRENELFNVIRDRSEK